MSENEVVVSVEELCARKTVKKVVGRSNHEQSPEIDVVISETQKKVSTVVNDGESVTSDIQELKEVMESLNKKSTSTTTTTTSTSTSTTTTAPASDQKPKPKIQKVPVVLRGHKNFKKYNEPRVVSIGPIHCGQTNLKLDEYKLKFLAKFIEESGAKIEDLYKIIKEQIHELKKLFDEEVIRGYDDKTLSRMLFVDGCFVLKFIESRVNGTLKSFDLKNDLAVYARQDFFLLENQIPFLVLKLLMDSCSDEFRLKLKNSIQDFICGNVMAPTDDPTVEKHRPSLFSMDNEPDPTHLLELLQKATSGANPMPSHSRTTPQSFRSVQELQTAGIDLQPSEGCSLIDIKFESGVCFRGSLKIPPLLVDDSTGPKFFNLVAYEMCPDNFRTDYQVTSYLCFMDSLIDDANDVKQLRSAKILRNFLGSDQEVASLFNEIATDLVPSHELYSDVKGQIQDHYNQKLATWMAQGLSTHFSTPWTVLAFLAVLLALALSVIQTWYTIHPAD